METTQQTKAIETYFNPILFRQDILDTFKALTCTGISIHCSVDTLFLMFG